MNLSRLAKSTQKYCVTVRRRLHQYPELSWKEYKTLRYIRQQIRILWSESEFHRKKSGSIKIVHAEGGLWVDLIVSDKLNMILFRADVDALAVEEATGLSYASQRKGIMHACGHDMHTAMLLAAFKSIINCHQIPNHNIRFVFQRAEECVEKSGGLMLVKEGVCKDIAKVYGLHIGALHTSGVFYSREGVVMANSDKIEVQIWCTGGHVATPNDGSNAVDIAIDVCNAMKGFDVRCSDPLEPISLVPSVVICGTADNVRPSVAKLTFSARNFLPRLQRKTFHQCVKEKIKRVVAAYSDARVRIDTFYGHPALVNERASVDFVARTLEKNSLSVDYVKPELGGEDFSYYLNVRSGSYWLLGASCKRCGDHHTPVFNPDERILWKGVLFWLSLAYTE